MMTAVSQRLARNVVLVIGGRAVGLAVNALTLMLIARSLGPERLGTYAVAFVFVSFFSTIIDNGVNLAVTRGLARQPESAPTLLGHAIALKIATGLASMAAATALVQLPLFSDDMRTVVPVASGLILVTGLSVVNAFFQSRLRVGIVVAGDVASRCAFLVFALLVLRAGGGVRALFAAQVASVAIGVLVVYAKTLQAVPLRLRVDVAGWRELLAPASSLSAIFALGLIAARADVMALSAYAGDREVGLYSAAFRVIDLLLLVPGLMMQVVFPVLVDRSDGATDRIEAGYRRLEDVLALLGLPLAILLTAFAGDVLRYAGGAAYVDGGPSLAILAWGMLAVFLSNGMYHVLIALGRERIVLFWSAAGAVTAVAAALVLTPRYHAAGAASAAVLAHTTMLAGAAGVLWRERGIRPWPRSAPGLAALGVVVAGLALAVRSAGGGLLVGAPLMAAAALGTVALMPRMRVEMLAILALSRRGAA
jgi:O-antigen/teichoic acid export membrane protein